MMHWNRAKNADKLNGIPTGELMFRLMLRDVDLLVLGVKV